MNLKLLGAYSALSLFVFANANAEPPSVRGHRIDKAARAGVMVNVDQLNHWNESHAKAKELGIPTAEYYAGKRAEERMAAQKEEARPEVVDGTPEVVDGTPAASGGIPEVEGRKFLRSPSPAPESGIEGEPSVEGGEGANEAGAEASAVEDGEGAGEEGPIVKGRLFGLLGKKVEGLSFNLDEFKEEINQKSFAELDNMLKEQNAVVASARGKLLHKMTSEEKIAENDANAKIKELSEVINRFATVSVDALDKDGLLFEKDRLEAKEKPSRAEQLRLEQINDELTKLEKEAGKKDMDSFLSGDN